MERLIEDKREDRRVRAVTHLIDCWVRSVRERWTECGRKNKVAVCLSLLWKRSQQNGTGNSRPEGKKRRKRKERMTRGEETV